MKILMVNVPYAGHVNPTLQLAKELVKRGHQVVYINAEEFRSQIEKTKATFVPYINFPQKVSERKKKRECFKAAYDTAISLEDSFDLLIYEMLFYPGIEIARKKGIPCVRQFSQPAWNVETMKEAPALLRLSAQIIDMQMMGKKRAGYMNLKNDTLMKAIVYDEPDMNVVYVPERFQKKREYFNAKYIFMIPSREFEQSAINIPYEKMKQPIIYISLGSIISSRIFYKKCIKALKNKDMSVILNMGKVNPNTLGEMPENIYAYSFVPQIDVLKHADVFVTHCGMNSINEAVQAEVPMIAIPFLNDQVENARQCVNLGLGKRFYLFPGWNKKLYKAICEVYEDRTIKMNLKHLNSLPQVKWATLIDKMEKLVRENSTVD